MFISLSGSKVGYACGIKNSMNNYFGKTQTHFFDWLICSMKSVNEILEEKPILFDSNYIYPNLENTTTINFSEFDLLISYHDIIEPTKKNLNEMNEKYIRRYARLINTIKTEKKIFFLRYCCDQYNFDEEQIHKFYNNINKINNSLEFYFVLITINNKINIPSSLLFRRHFLYINLNKKNDDDQQLNFMQIVQMYTHIFKIIDKLQSVSEESRQIQQNQIDHEIIQPKNNIIKKKKLILQKIAKFKQHNEK